MITAFLLKCTSCIKIRYIIIMSVKYTSQSKILNALESSEVNVLCILQKKQGVDKPRTIKLLIEFVLFFRLLFSTLLLSSFSSVLIRSVIVCYFNIIALFFMHTCQLYIAC